MDDYTIQITRKPNPVNAHLYMVKLNTGLWLTAIYHREFNKWFDPNPRVNDYINFPLRVVDWYDLTQLDKDNSIDTNRPLA